ncbi:MAG TPA: hypothetical protein PKW79_05465 [Rhabdochlamydiaceae bacterium]|nr:hypothetical protein [Rhabdochlamydiaceae bacterium]
MNYKKLAKKIKTALQNKPQNKNEVEKRHPHSYAAPSRVPSQLPQKPEPLSKIHRKTDIVTKEWNPEVKHTSEISSQLDSQYLPGAHLIPTRVHRWTIKNYAKIVRQIKSQIKAKEQELTAKVSHLTSSDEQKQSHEQQKQDELWRDMMKTQEERQYQITRITNFFT